MPLDIVTYWNPKTGIEKKKIVNCPIKTFYVCFGNEENPIVVSLGIVNKIHLSHYKCIFW